MKSQIKRILAGLLTAGMLVSMAACGDASAPASSGKAPVGNSTPNETTLKIYMFNDAPNLDKVLDKFYAQTKDTLNTKLDFIWNSAADHREKIPLMMGNQEEADLVFDAYWMNLSKMSSQGAYADVSSYFNNDAYPGLKAAFPEDFLKQVTNPDGTIYAIPFTQAAEDIQVILYRKDLREKYGMEPITSDEQLEEYFKKVQADITSGELPGMIAPIGIAGSRAFYYLDHDIFQKRAKNVYVIDGSGDGVGMEFEVAVSDDGKTVLGAATLGDPDAAYSSFPAPFNTNTRNDRVVNRLTKWAQYSQADAQTETDAKKNLFFAEKVAAIEGNISNYDEVKTTLQSLGKDVEVYVYTDMMRNGEKVVSAPLTAWNFLCIPQQSKKMDATMKFLDWLFSSKENHDLFEYGIEGEDWKAVGDSELESLSPSNKYVFPGYQMTWNPNFIRTDAGLPDEIKAIYKYQNDPDTYITSKIAGFTFDVEATPELKTAYASYAGVQATYRPILMMGLDKDPSKAQATLEEYRQQAQAAGQEIIRAEVIRQVQEHLDAYNG